METIWQHDVTEQELVILFGEAITPEEHRLITQGGADAENAALYRLYTIRGDEARAAEYLARIQDDAFRFDVAYVDLLS